MNKRFTLLELLVVIAIFGILITMLLPSLKNARVVSRSAVCMSNLKQLSTWGMSYAVNNNQVLPTDGNPSRVNYDAISNTAWYKKYSGYMRGEPTGTAMHCPQTTDSLRPRWQFQERNDFDYGLNGYLGGRKANWTPEVPRVNLLTSDKHWFGDGKTSQYNDKYYIWEYLDATSETRTSWMWEFPTLQGHMQNKSNFTFGDGHVEARSKLSVLSLAGEEKLRFRGTRTE
ncbi:MAG: type II secretion system GspH family protein [Lentisphaeraceae bacterium]|nr:type II secretion system GspH family protein [Lentisphaeraceae bacterium]